MNLFAKLKNNLLLLPALFMPISIFIFTLGKYYGYYYDNHHFNLLALDLMDKFQAIFYIQGYTLHSSFFSYLLYPLFNIFGPTDLSIELLAAFFHLGTIFICFKLGERFFNRIFGSIFATLVGIAPNYIINIYTWQVYSFISFLNILAIYYFTVALEERSLPKLITSSLLYTLSCFQAIYSLFLLPVFVIFALIHLILFKDKEFSTNQVHSGSSYIKKNLLPSIFYILVIIAFAYLILTLQAMFITRYVAIYYLIIVAVLLTGHCIYKKINERFRKILKFYSLFFLILAASLLLLDLFLQFDANFFNQKFLYHRNNYFAGGFGPMRPAFILAGRAIKLFGKQIYLAVFGPLFVFKPDYTGFYLNLSESLKIMVLYYKKCFPLEINIFFVSGIIALLIDILYKKYKKDRYSIIQVLGLSWFLGITISFINLNPSNMLRIANMPMPYFFAAYGVYSYGRAMQYVFGGKRKIFLLAIVIILLFLTLKQLFFLKENIFEKYKRDKANSNYFSLFNGWPYGRDYKEVGNFLLKDAPLKKGGKYRSIFIYSIITNPDSINGICAIFYNNIDWYTQNKIKIIYDIKPISILKYGSEESLRRYINQLLSENPDVQAIYFADFYDTKDNFSFFSKLHPGIPYYKIINDDTALDYDCILYKFQRAVFN